MLSTQMEFSTVKHKLENTLKLYRGKNKETVLAQGNFRREVLVETVFALKEISESLMGMVSELQTSTLSVSCQNLAKEMKCLKESLPNLVKDAIETNLAKQSDVNGFPKVSDGTKHSVLIESNNDDKFDQTAWNNVVKGNITHKLKNVPVKKTTYTKSGQGCLIFPTKEDQDIAERMLKDDFKVTKTTKLPAKILPKLKVFGVDCSLYTKGNKDELKKAILSKNSGVQELIKSGKIMEVVIVDENYHSAVLKVSPEVRQEIMKRGKLFIDMEAHHVKDDWHVMQCFACQEFGHKQDSDYCKNKSSGESCCLYCAEQHRSKDCGLKHDKAHHKCSNCLKSKIPHIKNGAYGHTSSSRDCPVYIKELNALVSRTEGISSKN